MHTILATFYEFDPSICFSQSHLFFLPHHLFFLIRTNYRKKAIQNSSVKIRATILQKTKNTTSTGDNNQVNPNKLRMLFGNVNTAEFTLNPRNGQSKSYVPEINEDVDITSEDIDTEINDHQNHENTLNR